MITVWSAGYTAVTSKRKYAITHGYICRENVTSQSKKKKREREREHFQCWIVCSNLGYHMIQKRQYVLPLVLVYKQPVLLSQTKECVQSPKI